jgi:hypothetical protein
MYRKAESHWQDLIGTADRENKGTPAERAGVPFVFSKGAAR